MTIPKTIHIIWIGGAIDNKHSVWLDSWRQMNPGWIVRLWDDGDSYEWIKNKFAFEISATMAGKADVLRLEILAAHGGFYSDADSECMRPIDDMVGDSDLGFMTGVSGRISNATMWAIPRHPFFLRCVDGLEAHVRNVINDPTVNIVHATGPGYLWRNIVAGEKYAHIDAGCKRGTRRRICWHDEACGTSDAIVVHHVDASWVGKPVWNRRVK